MRLIGSFQEEKQAYDFQTFLLKQGIQSSYDTHRNPEAKTLSFDFWIESEDDIPKAYQWYLEFQQNPSDPRFKRAKEEPVLAPSNSTVEKSRWKIRVEMPQNPPTVTFTLTNLFILLCAAIFFFNGFEAASILHQKGELALEYGTEIDQELLFDYPQYFENFKEFLDLYPIKTIKELDELPPEAKECYKKLQNAPTWKGFSELIVTRSLTDWRDLPPHTLFGKIRQGEIWRLFTPVLLHGSIIHILFNMIWLSILGKQIELRLGKFRYLFLILLLGVIPNVVQYLISGPNFIGFSGIVVGFAGFIWMREKVAPWEGYPLQKIVLIFLFVYVMAMLALEIVSMSLQFFHVTELSANIANAAHIVGGLLGMFFARLPFFSRSHQ